MSRTVDPAPIAQVTLRAYPPAPARAELVHRGVPERLLRVALCLACFWGAIPVLVGLPSHSAAIAFSLVAGFFLARHQWTGRYQVRSFAGICPRCGAPLSMGMDHLIDLPHTLTCFHCHFEPVLEMRSLQLDALLPVHQTPDCTGDWELRWLADAEFVVCTDCHAGCPATGAARDAADEENARSELLSRLTREGRQGY